jgi:pilus assembly protein CpaD
MCISSQARRRRLQLLATLAVPTLLLAACRPERTGEVAGWSMTDSAERHPIIVSQQPARLSIRVPRGSSGLTAQQHMQAMDFLARYRAVDAGNSRLVISVPSGTANEISAMQAAAQLRSLVREAGFDDGAISVEPIGGSPNSQPALQLSYLRYVVEAPECGNWPSNLGETRSNLPYPNFGCAAQRNLAAQVANPADLIGPRTATPKASERRDVVWDKYIRGESTISQKSGDEKTKE